MKNCQILIPTILFLVIFQSAFSQENDCCSYKNSINANISLPGELFISAGQIDNTTWYNKEWLLADIFLSNGEIARNKFVKYNGLIDELLWHDPESNIVIRIDKSAINYFHLLDNRGDTSVYFRRLKVKRDLIADSAEVFGEEIYHGKLSLYVLHSFYIERRELNVRKGVFYQDDIYTEEPVYYFRFQDNKTVGTKTLSRKSMNTLFSGKKEQIKMYYRQNDPGKNPDKTKLISLTRFLSSILYQ